MDMVRIQISEAEAARDFAAVLARARSGAEIITGDDASPAVVLRVASEPRGRLLSESIALAEAHARELGHEPVMDSGFAADLEEIISKRKPRDTSIWD